MKSQWFILSLGAVLLSALFGLTLAGCANRQTELENAVSKYNRLLPVAFETGDVSKMGRVIGETEYHRLEGFIQYQAMQGKPMRAKLKRLIFVKSWKEKGKGKEKGQEKGFVKTREWWFYRTDKELGSPKKVEHIYYEMRYELFKSREGGWFVDHIDVEKQRDLQ